jgi:ADP-ribose pyrophosphatase YjhB (NUDIX family)
MSENVSANLPNTAPQITSKPHPLSVAISALIKDNQILLIKRIRGDYLGYFGLPGGKVEVTEHLQTSAQREIQEETGLSTRFEEYLGLLSEHLIENGQIIKHFMLHLVKLTPISEGQKQDNEGESRWFDLATIIEHQNEIIPSDWLMIEKMILTHQKNYFECAMEKAGDEHRLVYFR